MAGMDKPAPTVVRLKSNGDYWQAFWRDGAGRAHAKSLGAKSRRTEDAARRACVRLGVDVDTGRVRTGNGGGAGVPRLSEWVAQCKRCRAGDVDGKTLALIDHTGRYLLAHFASDPPIDRLTRADAAEWRAALARGELRAKANRYPKPNAAKAGAARPLAPATVAKHVRAAKRMFEDATDESGVGYVDKNPFRQLSGRAPRAAKDWANVTAADLAKILDACPNAGWRCLFALARYAGLRRREALELEWRDVLWADNKLMVNARLKRKTTKRAARVCPIEPARCPPTGLSKILRDAFDAAPAGAVRVCAGVSPHNLDRQARHFVAAAGIAPYAKPFHALRKNRAGEVAAAYPQHVFTEWMGHSAEVAGEFYLRVEDDLYATLPNEAQKMAQNAESGPPTVHPAKG